MNELLKDVVIDADNRIAIVRDGSNLEITVMDKGYTDCYTLDSRHLANVMKFQDTDSLLDYIDSNSEDF